MAALRKHPLPPAALLAAVHYVEEPDREPATGGASDSPVAFVDAAAA